MWENLISLIPVSKGNLQAGKLVKRLRDHVTFSLLSSESKTQSRSVFFETDFQSRKNDVDGKRLAVRDFGSSIGSVHTL